VLAGHKQQDPIQKVTKANRAGGVAQVAEHMPTKQAQGPEFKPPVLQEKKKKKKGKIS
jgi:hypothetical protein